MKTAKSFTVKPLKKTKLYEEVADQIKQAIYDGQLKPGDRLPSERDLCQMFNVGRPTIREALRTLSVMGLVEISQGARGASVAKANISQYMEAMQEQLSWLIRADKKTLEELWEVRKYIELGIVHAASRKINKKEVKKLDQLISKMEACAEDFESYLPLAVEFHRVLARITENKVFILFWEMCHAIIIRGYMPILHEIFPNGPYELLDANKILLEAIKTKDTDAINKAMELHAEAEVFFKFASNKGAVP